MSLGDTRFSRLPIPVADAVATTIGRLHRKDPVAAATGGPAGNARLTAWTGLVLLVLFLVECVTLLSLGHMIGLHIIIGGVLVPLAVLKTATTGWRILRYYGGNADYRTAGPPPLLLRVFGPIVIVASFAVLGSGLALIPLGATSFNPFVSVLGVSVNAVAVHKACFVFWLGAVGLHVLTRLVSALVLVRPSDRVMRVGGGRLRLAIVSGVAALGVAVGLGAVHYSGAWTSHRLVQHDRSGHGD